MSKRAWRTLAISAIAATMTAGISLGVAQANPGPAQGNKATTSGVSSSTSTTRHSVRKKPYRLREVNSTSTLTWSDANAKLAPLPTTTAARAKANSAQATQLRRVRTTFAAAESTAGAGFKSWLTDTTVTADPTAELYSYTNNSYGKIQSDGTVKLSYVNLPVWMLDVPLDGPDTDASIGGPLSDTNPMNGYSGCSWYYIIDATNGQFLTDGQHCNKTP